MFARAVVLAGLLFASTLPVTNAQKLDVPYIKTPQAVVERMLEMGQVGPDDYLIDLGSGDGRIPIEAAKLHGTRGLGVDLDPERTLEATQGAKEAGVSDRVSFRTQNLFDTDIGKASVITMYLFPEINLKLRPHLLQLEPGTRVVSHAFHMNEWTPDRHEVVEGNDLFLWVVPARVQGLWRVSAKDSLGFTLQVWQQFNRVQGNAISLDERSIPLMDFKVNGPDITFSVNWPDGQVHYTGRMNGRLLQGTSSQGKVWQAERID